MHSLPSRSRLTLTITALVALTTACVALTSCSSSPSASSNPPPTDRALNAAPIAASPQPTVSSADASPDEVLAAEASAVDASPPPPVDRTQPFDTPEERTRRIETARQLDNESVTTLKNRNRTISVRGMQGWSGINGTGNLGYESCNIDRQCLTLTDGKMSCKQGICGMSWTNGDYGYRLTAPMANPDRPDPQVGYTLMVTQGDRVILTENGFTTVPSR